MSTPKCGPGAAPPAGLTAPVTASTVSRLIAISTLAALLVSGPSGASASTAPYSVSDIGPARVAAFKISDISATPQPSDTASDIATDAATAFKVTDIGSG